MVQMISRLETPRLVIRLVEDEDPRASLSSCQSSPFLWTSSRPLLASPVRSLLFYSSPRPPSNYHIYLKLPHGLKSPDGQKLPGGEKKIGIIGFFTWNTELGLGTIGFSIDKNFRNQGLMTEALTETRNAPTLPTQRLRKN